MDFNFLNISLKCFQSRLKLGIIGQNTCTFDDRAVLETLTMWCTGSHLFGGQKSSNWKKCETVFPRYHDQILMDFSL